MMRVSATTLESYRLWRQPEQDWMPEADLLATIRGQFVPTPQILAGQAFGKVLERPEKYRVPSGYQYREYTFAPETIDPCLALIDRAGVFEAKTEKRYETPRGPVNVVMKADHMRGAHLGEFKTTNSTYDFDKYAESCQWRLMVDGFNAIQVTYYVFRIDDHGNGVIELKEEPHVANLFPYQGLHDDCAALVRDFADYVTLRKLDGMLRARQQQAVA